MIDGIQDSTLYYIAMIAIYSGLGPWLASQLTRSQTQVSLATRASIDETLALVERLRTARAAAADPARQAAYDKMIERLVIESNDQISELNATAARLHAKPAERYLIIPAPRSAFGAFMTVVFAVCVYFAILFLLTSAFDFWVREGFDPATNAADRIRTITVAGIASSLALLAFLARFLAFRSYNQVSLRLREEAETAAKSGA